LLSSNSIMRNTNSILKFFIVIVCFVSCSATLLAQECGVIYVSPSGATSGIAGTRATPASLTYGLSLVSATNKHVWLAVGNYPISNSISIATNVTIEGGYDATTWIKSNVAQSTILRDSANFLTFPFNALVGIVGNAVNNFVLQDLTINVSNAPGHQVSVYGIYLAGCSNYNITRCTVISGNGSAGVAGAAGTAGINGNGGNSGNPGNNVQNPQPGGTGGNGGGGNKGGDGAVGGFWTGNFPGSDGLSAGCGGTGGTSGSGPCGGCGTCANATPGAAGTNGQAGTPGSVGAPGLSGIINTGYFVPGIAGTTGSAGISGCGGGGGGGGGGYQQGGFDGVGGSGGGGGGGGFGGNGGVGGTGGGASFAIFLYNNGAGGTIKDCLLTPGTGGAGGQGGAGGAGGNGGIGGAGGAGVCAQGNGGAGGNGGNGGVGGNGGDGAAGVSVALSENGGVAVSNLGSTVVPGNPPVIDIDGHGCTNAEVLVHSATSGTWDFGFGASPATANGTGPFSVFYSSLGPKTITFNGTIFTDYVDIFQAGPSTSGSILPSNGTVTVGCPNTFTTVLTGSYYQWYFGNTAAPDSMEGSTMQTVNNIYFSTPGTYTIYVYVTTACCGKVIDSTTVTVAPSTYNLTLTASPTSVCIGDSMTFTASPSNYLVYVFTVNDSVVQNGLNSTYSSNTLSIGDTVMVTALQGTCFTNPSNPVIAVVLPPPILTLISSDPDSTICSGESVLFIATPIGYTNYEFFDGGVSLQSGPNINYSTTNLQPGNSITVVASNLGCTGPPSNASVTTVNPTPNVVLTSSDSDNVLCGTGQSVTFTATPPGFATYDFIDSGNNVQTGAGNTYTTTTLANGSAMSAIATSAAGCIDTSNVIVTSVNPIPAVSISSSVPNDTSCQNVLITFTASPSGYDNYEFFNAGTSIQNGAGNTLSTTLNPGNSITVIATDLSCPSPTSNALVTTIILADPIDAGSDFGACINTAPITLAPITPANGTWAGQGITSPSPGVFDPVTAGAGSFNLAYSYINTSGCTSYDTAIVTVYPLPVIIVSPAVPALCEGSSMTLTANGASTYLWSPGTDLNTSVGASVITSAITTTTYTVVGTDNNCTDSITFTLTVNPAPTVSISGATAVSACESTELTAVAAPNSGGTYLWSPATNMTCATCATTVVSPLNPQTYIVTYTSPQGCSDSASVSLTIVSIFNYFMPTAFSPNGDGINDSLSVHGKGIQSISLQLFDRVGEKVFEATSIKQAWDGTFHGVPMNDGVFVYLLEVKFCNGETKKEQGNVTLAK
jgi:gliding motility-associated-like protein